MREVVSKTMRYPAHLDATVLLEDYIVHDWQPTDDRGQSAKTSDKTLIIVYTEAKQVKVVGLPHKVEKWLKPITERLNSLPVTAFSDHYLDPSIVSNTRGYIESVCRQINVCCLHDAFDGAAVLIRKMAETLIIEMFEAKGIIVKVKNGQGNFFQLSDLIQLALAESDDPSGKWNLSQNAKKALSELKTLGDLSAHNRTFVAKKSDVARVRTGIRVLAQEMLSIAGIK